jgi:hypothetical protein
MGDEPSAESLGEFNARVAGVPSFPGAGPWDSVRHPDLPAALHWVLEQVDRARATTADLWQAEEPNLGCTLIRTRGKELLLLSTHTDETVARATAALLENHGYHEAVLPGATALAVLRRHLSTRVYNQLTRHGFTTVEQVAAVPDAALMDIRLVGGPSIAAIRETLAAVKAALHPVEDVQLTTAQVAELIQLLAVLSTYAEGHGNHALAARADAFLIGLNPRT